MAATPPSSDVPVPPVSSVTPPPQPSSPPTPPQPQPSTPPPQSQPSTPPPQPQPSTPPPVSSSPPPVENQVPQPNADPPEPATPPPPSSPPPNSAPPPSNAGNPPPATPPPVDSSPPPAQNAPPPTPPASPPPTPVQPPPSSNSPPPQPGVSPPPPDPPVSSPPPAQPAPPPQSPPSPPTSAPPPPPTTSPSPPSSSSPPPTSSPSPPAPSSEPPAGNPPPSSTKPPESSPSPPTSTPPKSSPSPPAPEPPRSSPSPPAGEPPSDSPPSTSTPPPSDSQPASPPPSTPETPNPVPGTPQSPSLVTPSPGAPSLEGRNSSLGPPQNGQEGGNGGNSHTGAIAIGVVVGVLMLGLIGLVAFWVVKRKKRASGANGGGGYSGGYVIPASLGSSPRSDGKLLVKTGHPPFGGGSGTDTPTDHGGYGHSRAWFTYQELVEATGGFSDENLLGEGGFGYVYKGILTDGRVVAVKQLKVGGGQGEREFKAEVEIISRIHHRHLVSLVGYCIWESRRLLVYDYVPNNTLHFHLHGGGPFMDWATRVKIAAGSARGIAYLHEDCHPRIIHRDIKSSNILLDNNFEARVSDFGLAKLALDADTHVSTRVMGTFGYLAPEYATSGKLTEKSDVYSFGVVLLELITGRKPVDETQPLGDESLVEWARPLLTHAIDTGDFGSLVDPRLEKNYIESEMYRMIEAAGACVRHSAAKRPRMGQVVRAIDGISDSGDLSNGLRVGESQLYDSAQQSAEIRWFRRMAFGSQDISTDFYGPAIQNLAYSSQSDSSRQHSQSSQGLGLARPSAQNIHFPVQQGQGGDISRQHSQSSQNLAVLGQNVNLPAQHEHNETSQNLGFSRQSGQNVNFPPQQGQGGNIARQHSNSTYYHSTQHSLNQGSRNLNFSREDSLNR